MISPYLNLRSDIPSLFPYFMTHGSLHVAHTQAERITQGMNNKRWGTLGPPSRLPTVAREVFLLLAAVTPG